MYIQGELFIILKLIAAFVLGAFIGYDREKQNKDAGIRTYAAVCVGSTLFSAIADVLKDDSSESRVIANIVVGIGFLGAGTIYRNNSSNNAHGLTTAATIWVTAAVGVAVGLDMFLTAIVASLMLYFLLSIERQKWFKRWKENIKDKENDKNDG